MSKLIDINALNKNNEYINNKLDSKLNTSLKGTNNGLAELDNTGKVPSSQLPSFVDDVIEGYLYNGKFYKESAHTTEITAESGKIYTDLSSNKTYRWGGTAFVAILDSLALGETSSTAYRGDRGKVAYDHSQTAHAPSNAQANQNAFSNVIIGSTTIAADTTTDSLTLVAGSNITLTPDATNDKITIAATDTTYSAATTSANGLMSSTDKTKLDGIATGAEVNQNAFSSITNGTNTISASGKTDSLTIVGGGATSVSYDTTNKKLTISSTDNNTTYSANNGVGLSGTTFYNSGVRSISTGGSNGTISVNTNGTAADVAVKGLGSAAYTNSNAYAAASHSHSYLPLGGGTVTGVVKFEKSCYVHTTPGEAGKAGYIHAATINILSSYINNPIGFEFSRRSDAQNTIVYITFKNVDSADPGISSITVYGSTNNVFIHKSNTSTWDIYVQKTEAWDGICIYRATNIYEMTNNLTITWKSGLVTTLPSGYIQASFGGHISYADSAGAVAWSNVSGKPSTYSPSSHTHTKSQITDFPTIPTVNNGTLTIQKNGSTVQTFTANQSGNVTANITVPTKTSDITNDSGFITINHSHNYAGSSSAGGAATSLANFENNNSTGKNANDVTYNAHTYYSSNGPSTSLGASTDDGALYVQAYSTSWVAQIAQDYRNGNLFTRGKNNGTWKSWRKVVYSDDKIANASYADSAGSATSASSASNSSKLNGYSSDTAASANTIVRRDSNGYIKATYLNQSSNAETPTTSSYIMYANSDGWLRKSSLANIKTILGLGSAAYTNSNAYAGSGHTHGSIISRGQITGLKNATADTVGGISMLENYQNTDSQYPAYYGNVISMRGAGSGQILVGWSGTSGDNEKLYYRNKRDVSDANWSAWSTVYSDTNKPTANDVGALPISGGTLTGDLTVGTLNVSTITHTGTINVNQNLAINDRLTVTGTGELRNSVWIGYTMSGGQWTSNGSKSLTVSGDGTFGGEISGSTLRASSNAYISGNLDAYGTCYLGDVHCASIDNSGTFSTSGNSTMSGTLSVNGNVNVSSSITINGTTRTYGDLITYSMKPYETNKYNIGNSSKYYKNAYINKTYVGSNSCSWVDGRSNATIIQNTFNQYSPLLSMKTTNGSWEMGVYTNDILHFSYITDTNFNASNNTQTVDIQFKPDGIIGGKISNATYADSAGAVAWSNVSGKPSTYPPSSHTHTKSQITDFPTIPTVNNGTLSIQVGGTTQTTFTANQSGNSTFNLTKDMITGLGIPGSDTNTTYPISERAIDANYTTAYRTQTKGSSSSGYYISAIRTDTGSVSGAPIYSSGLAWGKGDTHGYLYVNYNGAEAYIGGGNADKLNWVDRIILNSEVNSAVSANSVVRRDANGYIYGAYFNQSSNAETPTTSSYLIFANSDGWFRKSSLANIKSILGLGSAAYTNSNAYAAASHNHTSLTNVYSITGDNEEGLEISSDNLNIESGSIILTSTSNSITITGETGIDLNDTTVTGTLTADKIVCKSNNKLGIAYASSASGNYQAGLRIGDITPGNTSYTTLCNDTVCANSLDVKGALKMSGTSVLNKFLQYVNTSTTNKSSIQTFSSYIKFKLNNATTIMIAWGCTNANNNTNISFPTSFSYIPSVTLSDYYNTTNSAISFGGVGTARKQLISVTTSAFKYRGISEIGSDEETPHYTFWIAVGVSS